MPCAALAQAARPGVGGVAFQSIGITASNPQLQDDMSHDPDDSVPVFIAATRLIFQPAGKVAPASCTLTCTRTR